MIVDDHEMFAEILVRLLAEDPEIDVIGAVTTAGEGIDRARQERPDIVLMDFGLSDMDGAKGIRLIREACPGVKVITVTGSDHPGAYYQAIEAGTSAWVRKTAAVQDLSAAIHSVYRGESVSNDELSALPPLEQLAVHYQPIIEMGSDTVAGFEALVRWQHPDRGLILPGEFLPRAEETGFINELGRHVTGEACRQIARWQQRPVAGRELWVSVNVSASGVKRGDLADDVARAIESSGVHPQNLILEITENVLMEDAPSALVQLERLKALGVRLALDDFGTGYSSLSYLSQFPFDHVKLDIAFTAELPHSVRGMQLAVAIHQLASALGMLGIAEGVERAEQAGALRDIGWEYGQGFLYSKAVDSNAAEMLCRQPQSAFTAIGRMF